MTDDWQAVHKDGKHKRCHSGLASGTRVTRQHTYCSIECHTVTGQLKEFTTMAKTTRPSQLHVLTKIASIANEHSQLQIQLQACIFNLQADHSRPAKWLMFNPSGQIPTS